MFALYSNRNISVMWAKMLL